MRSRNRVAVLSWVTLATVLSSSVVTQPAVAQDEQPIKQKIISGLQGSWKVTGFENVDSSAAGPWGGMLDANYRGYAFACEDVSRTIEEPGGKSDGAGNARRHPRFDLWFFRRSASLTPQKVRADLQDLRLSPIQRQVPELLGFGRDYVVTCTYDCSEKPVAEISKVLKLQTFSAEGDKPK
jgi:hypothetical protein